MSTEKVPYDFNPDIRHPIYLVRNRILKAVKKYIPELNGTLMDFGCGAKPYHSLFNVTKYIGVDLYNPAHSHENEPVDVFYDGNNIPFPDNHFDAVFSSEVFEHVFNLDNILKEINRVMKPDGKMLITCPFAYPEHEAPYDYARYTVFALKEILTRNGFEIITIEKTGNSVEAIMQLQLIDMVSYKSKIRLINGIYWRVVVLWMNISALLLSKLLPERKTMYLNNVVLCKKII